MSLGDAFADAVVDIDRYLREGWGSAAHDRPHFPEVVACRNEMERLRCVIDADAMGVPVEQAMRSYTELDLTDPDDDDEAEDDD